MMNKIRASVAVAVRPVLLALVAGGLLPSGREGGAAAAAEPAAAAAAGGKIELVSRAVAVKEVCAWPNLTKLGDGTVVATIFNQPCHGNWEGDVDCWATTDGGKSWEFLGRPAPHEPTTNRMNVAAGVNGKGELIVLASGWSHRPRRGEGAAGHGGQARPLLPWVCRSADGGKTWTYAEGIELPSTSRLAATEQLSDRIIPFGDIIPLGGGKLGACLYAWHPETKTHDSYFFTSADDGATWQLAGVIGRGGLNETTPLRLSGGDLLACARTFKDQSPGNEQRLELFRSTDNGASWTREQAVSEPMEHPAHLLELADGRVLLTYGDRTHSSWRSNWPDGSAGKAEFPNGIKTRISSDGGRTWSPPVRIADFDGDGGYPATVELADGRLLTAFYARRTADCDGYHMATVTWRYPQQ